MVREMTVRRLAAGTVYKIVAIGLACSIIPLSLLTGALAMFGVSTVMLNHRTVTGIAALFLTPLAGAMMVLMLTLLLGSGMALGLWLFSKFRPLTLMVIDPGEPADGGVQRSHEATR